MHTVPDFASTDKLYVPRPGAPMRYGHYFGFEGYVTVDAPLSHQRRPLETRGERQ